MTNKTVLSVAISCILWGGISAAAFANLATTTEAVVDDVVTATEPQPTGTTQPQPQPTGTTQPQPQPTGTTQPQPQPTGTTQPQPQPTGTTQPLPPQPTGTTQPLPPQPTGTTQPQPPQPTGTTQPQPPQPTGTTQPQPPQPTGTTQPLPPQPTGTTQPLPPQPTGTTQPLPPQPTGTTQPTPATPVDPDDGVEQPRPPKPPVGGNEQPKPTINPTTPVDPDDGVEQPRPPKPPINPNGGTEQPKPNKPNFSDFGVDENDIPKFDAEKLQKLPPQAFGAFDKNHIKQMPAEAMTQITAEQVSKLPTDAVDALKPEQVSKMPPNAMVGLTAKQIGSLPPVVLQKLPAEHFKNLNTQEVKALGNDFGKVVVNLDATQIKPQEVKVRLPEGWQMDDKGRLIPPAGTKIVLPPKNPAQVNVKVQVTAEVPDLNKTFALGGAAEGSATVLDGMNACLKTAGFPNFKIKQETSGTLLVEGSGEAAGTELTFTPDSDSMKQVAQEVPTGLSQDTAGNFVLTTPDKQQVVVRPAPKDTNQVVETLGAAGSLKMDKQGVVTLELRKDGQSPKHVRPVMFDSMVVKAAPGKKPGIYTEGTTGEVVYADGTAQKIMPTVPVPDKFVEKAKAFPGVENAQLGADGCFHVKYKGMNLKLRPLQFDVQATPVAEGQTVESNITVQSDGTVKYTTQDEAGDDQLEVTLAITE